MNQGLAVYLSTRLALFRHFLFQNLKTQTSGSKISLIYRSKRRVIQCLWQAKYYSFGSETQFRVYRYHLQHV